MQSRISIEEVRRLEGADDAEWVDRLDLLSNR
jgi:hypothetical protein